MLLKLPKKHGRTHGIVYLIGFMNSIQKWVGDFVMFVEKKRVTLFLQHVDLSTLKFIHFKTIPSLKDTRI